MLHLRDYSTHTLASRSASCIFIGYNTIYRGYWCLDPTTNNLYTTRHAQLDETTLPFANGSYTSSNLNTLLITSFDEGTPSFQSSSPEDAPSSITMRNHSTRETCPICITIVSPDQPPLASPSNPPTSPPHYNIATPSPPRSTNH